MMNDRKLDLKTILENHRDNVISTAYAMALINGFYLGKTEVEIGVVNNFECEFKSVGNKAICKNYNCNPACLKKMKAEYIIFKEQQKSKT